jgi:hypothetical protein
MINARATLLIALAALAIFDTAVFANEEMLARAKDLYANAAYEEALVLLDRLRDEPAPSQRVEVSEYRLFCLIALGRSAEARVAIRTLVESDPLYQLSSGRASPRVLGIFKEVRRDLLPGLIERAYAEAKVAFDQKDPNATVRFERVIDLLDDPAAASYPALVDLRIVVTGFRDLSRAFSLPTAIEAAKPQASASIAAAEPPALKARTIYREGDPDVVPAVPVDQKLPRLVLSSDSRGRQLQGTLELVVDENGDVVAVTLSRPIHPRYDSEIVSAARSWKYIPARKDGNNIAVRRVVAVRIVPE